jgi:Holliday junction resolvase RusA-like endonuclease
VAVLFTVLGTPAPKGSRIVGRRRDGSTYTRPAAKGEKAWVEAVAAEARTFDPLEAPYTIAVFFRLPRPMRPAHEWPTRGDLDKFVRATLDGLTLGGLISDDRHVVQLVAEKAWADAESAGAEIWVAHGG